MTKRIVTETRLFVPVQQQSSLRLPSYWWQEKTRCYRWFGSAPAAPRTLSATLRTDAAPGLLRNTQGISQKQARTQLKKTGAVGLWVR